MKASLHVQAHPPYPVYIGLNLLNNKKLWNQHIKSGQRVVLITDSLVEKLYAPALLQALGEHKPLLLTFEAGEKNKNRKTKADLEDAMLKHHVNRDACIIALGGGVVTDLAGFIAATYCRGVPVLYAPTTLLAMVDAGIGGKTGVNTPAGKNFIGAFYQPKAVCMDLLTLKSLALPEFDNGVAEMLKHALISGYDSLEELLNAQKEGTDQDRHWLLHDQNNLSSLLARNIMVKKKLVEADIHDHSLRQHLNFGHSIGHAVEQLSNYTLAHGHAVSIGMLLESRLSLQEGFLNAEEFQNILAAFKLCNFPLSCPWLDDVEKIYNLMLLDKKSTSTEARVVMLQGIGNPCPNTKPVSLAALKQSVTWLQKQNFTTT